MANNKILKKGSDLIKSSLVRAAVFVPQILEEKSPDELLGELFSDVQIQQVFPDGKTFVDLVPKKRLAAIKNEYALLRRDPNFNLNEFVSKHFYDVADVLGVNKFVFDEKRNVTEHISALWSHLERKNRKDRGSLLALPYPYYVPGGRFNEQFYWDSYFIMLGLAADGKWNQLENVMKNFAYEIRKYGFIPTANRTYFLSRSQPPFFSHMVRLLAEKKGKRILVQYLPLMLAEYRFWMKGKSKLSADIAAYRRVVRMPNGVVLNRYYDDKATPRPESHREDVATAAAFGGLSHDQLYLHLRAAAESGWDFSSRWFLESNDIASIRTTDIVPIDLNALLYHLEVAIAEAYKLLLQPLLARRYKTLAEQRKRTINKYLWDDKEGFFVDYNFWLAKPTGVLSLAGVFPLYVGLANKGQARHVSEKLKKSFLKPGGLVTTLIDNGQQWDSPNGWAPLQWIAIKGLQQYHFPELAHEIRHRWIKLNVDVFNTTHRLVEKYNVMGGNGLGGGGEYLLQDGFGWTNGVLLALIKDAEKDEKK